MFLSKQNIDDNFIFLIVGSIHEYFLHSQANKYTDLHSGKAAPPRGSHNLAALTKPE